MDEIDRRILHVLSSEGRLSNAALAERVNLSASACLRRVQELERQGIIVGYRAVVNRAAMGVGLTVYVTVGLSNHTKVAQKGFERAIALAPQVRECHNVTGAVEYILRVEVADLAAFKQFHTDVLGVLPDVASITSFMVMESPKDERG